MKKEQSRTLLLWQELMRRTTVIAVVLVIAMCLGCAMKPENNPIGLNAYAIEEADYPEKALQPEANYADGLEMFFADSVQQFLADSDGENIAYSPLNVYMALGMLAEITDGNSRQQILDLMKAESIDTLRTQAKSVWNAHYYEDEGSKSVLASSLWLNKDISFQEDAMKNLADIYYASSYQGAMGSEEFNQALQTWFNEQTGGLLEDQTQNIKLNKDTILALATTIYYQAKWSEEFIEGNTTQDVFHAATGDVDCDFMHSSDAQDYYWGEQFSAVEKYLGYNGEKMQLILPNEGVSVEEMLAETETMDFILRQGEWKNSKEATVNLELPKFDISSQMDLIKGLQTLGVTDVFDREQSDFSPMMKDADGTFVSEAKHGVRVKVDEKGVEASAYTVMALNKMAMPPAEQIDFVLDRPFLFVITSADGLPMFVGIVNQPS